MTWKLIRVFWSLEETLEAISTGRCSLKLVETAVERPLTQKNSELLERFNHVIHALEIYAFEV